MKGRRQHLLVQLQQILGDVGIVRRRDGKRLLCQFSPRLRSDASPRCQVRQHDSVVPRIGHHGHPCEVLGRRPDQCHPPDVDVLHGISQRGLGPGHRLDKRVKVDHYQIDDRPAVRFECRPVGLRISRQNPCMDGRV